MRIGKVFIAAGLTMAAIGVALPISGGHFAWVLLAWLGMSLLVVGAGYLGVGARVLGKRSDGSLPRSRVFLLLPYFAITWGAWHLIRLGTERCWHEVAPGVYVGRRPLRGELPEDVKWVVDLTAEFPKARSVPIDCRYETLPTLDGHVPAADVLVDLAVRVSKFTEPVYIHCAQGHGRAVVAAASVLIARGVVTDGSSAEQLLRGIRSGIHLSSGQRNMIERIATRLGAASPS